jgi:lysophospholipase L1-like esterase
VASRSSCKMAAPVRALGLSLGFSLLAASWTMAHPRVAAAADAGTAAPAASTASAGSASAVAPTAKDFEGDIRVFEEADRELKSQPPRVVFIGSSSVRMWESLAADFPGHTVVNRGFGGSHVVDSVYFGDRILKKHKPRLIVMFAGTNDINAGKKAGTVAADFKAFTEKVWASWPKAVIAFISISPSPSRVNQLATVKEANRAIAAYCETDKRLKFVDVFPSMVRWDGRPKPDIFQGDGLHMTRKGYELWIPPLREVLDTFDPPAASAKAH